MGATISESRRDFLISATLGGALSAGARATPQAAASGERIAGANDVVNIGLIGCGDISQTNIPRLNQLGKKVRIVAVCDIFKPNLERAMAQTKAEGYHDYRDLLARKDLHVVVIMTPDHWHAQMAIDAMRAGKDVDVEKPMSLTIEEAKQMVQVARDTGRILSVDSEHTAHGIWQVARTAVQSGVTGKLVWSQTSRSSNGGDRRDSNRQPTEVKKTGVAITPQNLDWERFLGPAPKRPFDAHRFANWRNYWDYSRGLAFDLILHHLVPLIKVTGPEFPISVTASGGNVVYPVTETSQTYDTMIMNATYPSGHTIVGIGSFANSVEVPITIRAHEATLRFYGPDQRRPAYMIIEPEGPYVKEFPDKLRKAGIEGRWVDTQPRMEALSFAGLPEQRQEEMISELIQYDGIEGEEDRRADWEAAVKKDPSLGKDRARRIAYFAKVIQQRAPRAKPCLHVDSPQCESFYENFIRCVRERKTPVLDGRLGYMAEVAVALAVRSLREQKAMFFDPKTEKVLDAPPAKG
jgi:predicted dehydrogenase